jgi:hypothetical protein
MQRLELRPQSSGLAEAGGAGDGHGREPHPRLTVPLNATAAGQGGVAPVPRGSAPGTCGHSVHQRRPKGISQPSFILNLFVSWPTCTLGPTPNNMSPILIFQKIPCRLLSSNTFHRHTTEKLLTLTFFLEELNVWRLLAPSNPTSSFFFTTREEKR